MEFFSQVMNTPWQEKHPRNERVNPDTIRDHRNHQWLQFTTKWDDPKKVVCRGFGDTPIYKNQHEKYTTVSAWLQKVTRKVVPQSMLSAKLGSTFYSRNSSVYGGYAWNLVKIR